MMQGKSPEAAAKEALAEKVALLESATVAFQKGTKTLEEARQVFSKVLVPETHYFIHSFLLLHVYLQKIMRKLVYLHPYYRPCMAHDKLKSCFEIVKRLLSR